MKDNDLLYQVALTRVPHIGDVHAKMLAEIYGSAQNIFHAPKKELEKIEGIGPARARAIRHFNSFAECEREITFLDKYGIKALFVTSKEYPRRLLHCYDGPALLYYKGNADLNADRIISVVGTRKNSAYGKAVCESFLEGLQGSGILVVSGLAFGIDTIAHKAALRHGLSTVATLAHGLDRIYPVQNRNLAGHMLEQGGLLTDFGQGTAPDKQHFPRRNRITAGMCDALIVIESGATGGSLITADIANNYNRDVFAVPGRLNDPGSIGCNQLIRQNKAILFCSPQEFMEAMNWTPRDKPGKIKQRELFPELSPEEKALVDHLGKSPACHFDTLMYQARLSSSALSSLLLNLELQGLVSSLPGKMYKLL